MKIQRNLSASSISNRWLNEFKLLAEPKRRQIDASSESRIPPVYSRGPSKTRRLIRGKLGSLVEIDSKVFNRGSEASLRNFYSKLYFSSPSRRKNTRRSISLAFNLYTCIDSCVVYLCANRCFRSVCLLSGRKTSARSTST